jgi:cytochrome c oxidase subunit 3
MSEATAHIPAADEKDSHGGHDPHDHGHGNPNLAHHFDSMEQQYDSGKLGMWVFLATELLMFGGLFCAYSVYRSNHPEVFLYAHHHLDMKMGAINTAILLASSLTMAWAVRASQLNKNMALIGLCLATLLGGGGFMVIKALEYNHKFHMGYGPGYTSRYNVDYKGENGKNNAYGVKEFEAEVAKLAPAQVEHHGIAKTPAQPYGYMDPNAGGNDAAVIVPQINQSGPVAPSQTIEATASKNTANTTVKEHRPGEEVASGADTHQHATAAEGGHGEEAHGEVKFTDLTQQLSRQRVNTFFGIYYCMTGLHGVHVLVGMALIFWITYRAGDTFARAWILPLLPIGIGAYLVFLYSIDFVIPTPTDIHHVAHSLLIAGIVFVALGAAWMLLRVSSAARKPRVVGAFNETYYAPVDLVGLYWHLVDLIWIFLFPLLYLIHGNVGS